MRGKDDDPRVHRNLLETSDVVNGLAVTNQQEMEHHLQQRTLLKVIPVAGQPPTGNGASHGSRHTDRQLELPEESCQDQEMVSVWSLLEVRLESV